MKSLTLELNIALIPNTATTTQLTNISHDLARRLPAIVKLGPSDRRLTLAPHLTLYQLPLALDSLAKADELLAEIARHTPVQTLSATKYQYNADEASFELQREITDELISLQNEVIAVLNPLRGKLLLEKDPAGNSVRATAQRDDAIGKIVQQTGYGEAGEFFRPHDTLNWFERGTAVNINSLTLPDPSALRGTYEALGMFVLGPQGTCPQLLEKYLLSSV